MQVYSTTSTWELIGKDSALMWVYTNTHTWELIGKDVGLTWVNTNTPTWEHIGTVTWVYTNTLTRELNRYRPDRIRPDRHTLNLSRIDVLVLFFCCSWINRTTMIISQCQWVPAVILFLFL